MMTINARNNENQMIFTMVEKGCTTAELKKSVMQLTPTGLEQLLADGIFHHIARYAMNVDMVTWIAGVIGNVDVPDSFGETALIHAMRGKNRIAVRRLLELGASTSCRDNLGRTPFLYAVIAGDSAMMEILHEFGANPFAVDQQGNSAFHLAAMYCSDPACFEYLHSIGCKKDIFNFRNESPVDVVSCNRYPKIPLDFLLEHGCQLRKDILFRSAAGKQYHYLLFLLKSGFVRDLDSVDSARLVQKLKVDRVSFLEENTLQKCSETGVAGMNDWSDDEECVVDQILNILAPETSAAPLIRTERSSVSRWNSIFHLRSHRRIMFSL